MNARSWMQRRTPRPRCPLVLSQRGRLSRQVAPMVPVPRRALCCAAQPPFCGPVRHYRGQVQVLSSYPGPSIIYCLCLLCHVHVQPQAPFVILP